MNSIQKSIDANLIKERAQCSFDVSELTYFFDDGKQYTEQRRKFENIMLGLKEFKDPVPAEYLSHKEKYENAIRKSCFLAKITKENIQDLLSDLTGNLRINGPIARISHAVIKDVSPFLMHFGMFAPTIIGQGNAEQQAYWLPRAMDMNVLGAYAQLYFLTTSTFLYSVAPLSKTAGSVFLKNFIGSLLEPIFRRFRACTVRAIKVCGSEVGCVWAFAGHGTFIRGLETTATYDPETEEFILNSPTLTSYKWWPGGMGHTANHCIVAAQLYTKGECHGIHNFIVQIRDEETHMPRQGVRVGEIGPKMGCNTADHGFLGFQNYRVPRESLLMKNSQVLKDGTYVKPTNVKLTYGTMVYVRVALVSEVALHLAKAATIAIRYSAVRHQSQIKLDEPEPQILDYVTQQHKLFICVATSYALDMAGKWLWTTYKEVSSDIRDGKTDNLPELHALACCLKAISTADAAACIEKCRLACGGHGYMLSSNLPLIYGLVAATCVYEGDNTVLLLQTTRYLVKAWDQAMNGKVVTPTVSYLQHEHNNRYKKWDNSIENIITGFQTVAAGKISSSVKSLNKRINSGLAYEDAWNMSSVQLAMAAEAHCRAVLVNTYWTETERRTVSLSSNTRAILQTLAELYIVYWALERLGDLLQFTSISESDIEGLQARYEQLLSRLRPDAVPIVDAFDFRDEVLNSTLGSYDGRVYERLMEEALKSPLNAEPVNRTFHTHLKPFMQGKL